MLNIFFLEKFKNLFFITIEMNKNYRQNKERLKARKRKEGPGGGSLPLATAAGGSGITHIPGQPAMP